MELDLNNIREQLDVIDNQVTELFIKRMQLSAQVAQYKAEHNMQIYVPSRERAILQRVGDQATALGGDEMDEYTRLLYHTIFDLSRAYQARLLGKDTPLVDRIRNARENTPKIFPKKGIVACQGVEGAYSQQACEKIFPYANIMYFRNFDGVFNAVEKGLCQYGVLPIENSSHGSVNAVFDLMRQHNFHIVRSVKLPVQHALLGNPGTKLSGVREIISHEQGLGQCSAFVKSLGDVTVTVCENTAVAAKLVSESGRTDIVAISSYNCAELYGLEVVAEHIQNSENNFTRFICIAKDMAIYPGANRISIMFTLPHQPGALYRMIARFFAMGLNIVKLESRPIAGRDFEFMFYFDLEASAYSDEAIRLLGELESGSEQFAFLGCFSEV
ncbi:MAG: chorismate mutase [Clostridia bacterium]|nr:chorismate mutase [Clostridia bacterium]